MIKCINLMCHDLDLGPSHDTGNVTPEGIPSKPHVHIIIIHKVK